MWFMHNDCCAEAFSCVLYCPVLLSVFVDGFYFLFMLFNVVCAWKCSHSVCKAWRVCGAWLTHPAVPISSPFSCCWYIDCSRATTRWWWCYYYCRYGVVYICNGASFLALFKTSPEGNLTYRAPPTPHPQYSARLVLKCFLKCAKYVATCFQRICQDAPE